MDLEVPRSIRGGGTNKINDLVPATLVTRNSLRLCLGRHYCRRDGTGFNVFYVAEHDQAEQFKKRFGWEFHDAKLEPRWWRRKRAAS